MSDHTDIRDVIDNLFTFLERVKIYLSRRLHPLEKEVGWKLFFFTHHLIVLFFLEIVGDKFAIVSFAHKDVSSLYFLTFVEVHIIECGVCEDWELIWKPFVGSLIEPFVLGTVTLKLAFEPAVDWPVVILNVMVKFRLKFIGIEHLDSAFLPSCSNRFAFSHVNLDMYHSMRKRFELGIIVGCAVED